MDFLGVDIIEILERDLIHLTIISLLGIIILNYVSKFYYFEKRGLSRAFIVIIYGGILFFILEFVPYIGVGIGTIFYWYIIKTIYEVGWDRALIAWFFSIFIPFFISILVLIFFGIDIIFSPNL
jgi:hypothetical protein